MKLGASMEFIAENKKQEIIYWCKRIYQKGMSPATSGNVSIKLGKEILISASGTCMNDMDEDDVVLIDYDGNVKEGTKKPSSEKIMHSEIYTRRDDINAVIHCHCPVITAFAVANVAMEKPILPDFVLVFGEVPVIPYFCPSSIELAMAVGNAFENKSAILLQNHGVVVADETLQGAYYKLELLRAYAEVYFGAEVLGGAKKISKKGVAQIHQLYGKK